MQKERRHKNDTRTFEELSFADQARAINAHTVWYLKATESHVRKAGTTRQPQAIRDKIAHQLRSMADQIAPHSTH